MIVRILTEGQFNLPEAYMDELNQIDNQLVEVVEQADREEFERLLEKMLNLVRENGAALSVEELVSSDLSLPSPDITLEEAKEMFAGEGLIPG
mgnify:CR=1 FL=1